MIQEKIKAILPDRVQAFFSRSRTIFVARLYTFLGVLAAAGSYILPWLSGQDLTPIVARLFNDIPEDLRPLAVSIAIAATGEIFVALRKITDRSLEEKRDDAEQPR